MKGERKQRHKSGGSVHLPPTPLTSPDCGSDSRTTILIKVVFPAPLTPVTPTLDARHSFRLAPSICGLADPGYWKLQSRMVRMFLVVEVMPSSGPGLGNLKRSDAAASS